MRRDVCTVLPSQETPPPPPPPSSSSNTQSTPRWSCGLNPWPLPLTNSCHICISSPLKVRTGGWLREPPPLPLPVQQASFSSQWPPVQSYQPGQQSGVNAPSAPIVSELMKSSLPVPSHSMTTRQMTNGNALNGYRHTGGVKVTESQLVLAPRPEAVMSAAVDALSMSTLGSIWIQAAPRSHRRRCFILKWMVLRWRRKSQSLGVFSPQKMEGGTWMF